MAFGITGYRKENTTKIDLYIDVIAAARSEEWNVFSRSSTETVGSNPTQGIVICVW
jgi:hypothetical protein